MAQNTVLADEGKSGAAPSVTGSVGTVERPAQVLPPEPPELMEHEKWLFENPEARAMIERGLADLAAGRVHTGRSFIEYADIDVDE